MLLYYIKLGLGTLVNIDTTILVYLVLITYFHTLYNLMGESERVLSATEYRSR